MGLFGPIKIFFADKAYPFVRDVATLLRTIIFIDDDGKLNYRQAPVRGKTITNQCMVQVAHQL